VLNRNAAVILLALDLLTIHTLQLLVQNILQAACISARGHVFRLILHDIVCGCLKIALKDNNAILACCITQNSRNPLFVEWCVHNFCSVFAFVPRRERSCFSCHCAVFQLLLFENTGQKRTCEFHAGFIGGCFCLS
jgi:hypothetical protein